MASLALKDADSFYHRLCMETDKAKGILTEQRFMKLTAAMLLFFLFLKSIEDRIFQR